MATIQDERQQQVTLRNITWETYEQLLEARGESRVPRYTYGMGVLEITSPLLPEHEEYSRNAELLARLLAEELSIEVRSFGSMTLKRDDIREGVEADGSFYISSEPKIRGKVRPNLQVDPPPDLVIEIDITNSSRDKLAKYERFGVPEVWRYAVRGLEIYLLDTDGYHESGESRVLPGVAADSVTLLLEEVRRSPSTVWAGRVRASARGLPGRNV